MAKIAILGAGGFGISLGVLFEQSKHNVSIWSHTPATVQMLLTEHEHKKLLPGIKISPDINITGDISCVKDMDIIIIATPSAAVRSTCQTIAALLSERTVVACVSKGLEQGTYKDIYHVMEEELANPLVILSGPSHAEEVGRGEATTVVAASENKDAAQFIQKTLMNKSFRIYTNDDVIGVELGGALKNIIALAAGIGDGLGLGDNAKAALMTRGIAEISRLGVALGGRAETFGGLSGIGDLIVTCTSMHSRNRRTGILIGQGMNGTDAVKEIGMTVEGVGSTKVAYELSQQVGIDMPIVTQVYKVLFENKNAAEAVNELMARPGK
ncbi:MAG: NAD(P)H-dependent glycerol-3-phosphate dehydrogenase, partial [Oscillospiraceae bacterium]